MRSLPEVLNCKPYSERGLFLHIKSVHCKKVRGENAEDSYSQKNPHTVIKPST